MSIHVVLADDSEPMRKAIRHLLEKAPEIQVVAETVTFAETIHIVGKLHPKVVVLDLHMRDENNVTPLHVKSCLLKSCVLAISFSNDDEAKDLAKSFGALTLLDKMQLASELIPAIKHCAAHYAQLTFRRRIFGKLVDGLTSK